MRKFLFICLLLSISGGVCASQKSAKDPLAEAARAGDTISQLKLADEYFFGRNKRTVNPALAAYWFRKAADANNARAQFNYGVCCLKGWGVKPSPQTGYYWISRAAEQKLDVALIMQSEILFRGLPAEDEQEKKFAPLSADVPKALGILRHLAGSGNANAAKSLAALLMSDVKLRDEHASEIRKNSAFAVSRMPMDVTAVLLYSTVLQNGIGGSVNTTEAVELLQRIVDVSPEAMARLSDAYEYGVAVRRDCRKAFELCRLAASKGSCRALFALGNRYLEENMVKHDPEAAFKCFERSAAGAYPPAFAALGKCFLNGVGVDKDTEKAFRAFWNGASSGDPESQYWLGFCFLNGIGTPADASGAVHWFRLSAEAGNAQAMRELGCCMLRGIGSSMDTVTGTALLKQAAERGDTGAMEILKKEFAL